MEKSARKCTSVVCEGAAVLSTLQRVGRRVRVEEKLTPPIESPLSTLLLAVRILNIGVGSLRFSFRCIEGSGLRILRLRVRDRLLRFGICQYWCRRWWRCFWMPYYQRPRLWLGRNHFLRIRWPCFQRLCFRNPQIRRH